MSNNVDNAFPYFMLSTVSVLKRKLKTKYYEGDLNKGFMYFIKLKSILLRDSKYRPTELLNTPLSLVKTAF